MSSGSRPDRRVLIVGVVAALVVAFARPVAYLFQVARDAEIASGLTLGPALAILTGALIFHQWSNRQDAKARAAAAEIEAAQAEARAEEMERLVVFGQSLGRSLDLDSIRDVVALQLPDLAGSDRTWVVVRNGETWDALPALGAASTELDDLRERVLARALLEDGRGWTSDPLWTHGHLCVPMIAGGKAVGLMAVPGSAAEFTEARQQSLSAAAAVLAIAVRNAQLFREVRENSVRDGLTGCYNRKHALELFETEMRRSRRTLLPVSAIMFDLDHFKDVNDRWGHLCGDAVLTAIGELMRTALRGSDIKCRFGGEEFLVILPETPIEGARRVVDLVEGGDGHADRQFRRDHGASARNGCEHDHRPRRRGAVSRQGRRSELRALLD